MCRWLAELPQNSVWRLSPRPLGATPQAGRGQGPYQDRHRRRHVDVARIIDMDSACEVRIARERIGAAALVRDGHRHRHAHRARDGARRGSGAHPRADRRPDRRHAVADRPASGGSKTLIGITPAVRQAAHKAKGKLLAAVARKLGVAASELRVVPGRVEAIGDPANGLAWKACQRRHRRGHRQRGLQRNRRAHPRAADDAVHRS
jgi:hypothetical protein